MGMDSQCRHYRPANVVGLLRGKISRVNEMNVEHRTTPIEHWIVDGKAYRLATEADIGREVWRSDVSFEAAINGDTATFTKYIAGDDHPFVTVCRWKYAYVQDDSLLTPQRVPMPELGEGWYLLTVGDVVQAGDKFTACGPDGWVNVQCSIGDAVSSSNNPYRMWARYFGAAQPEVKPVPAEQPPSIDWTKPVRTKDGRAVRVLCTDGPGDQPVIGIIDGADGVDYWCINGRFFFDGVNRRDLENVPPEPKRIRVERWANVYGDDEFFWWSSRESADRSAKPGRFACVKITIDCAEGEGLDVQP